MLKSECNYQVCSGSNTKMADQITSNPIKPRNFGEIKDADGIGKISNPLCGDNMLIFIKVKDERLEDVKFKLFGCDAAIATSNMVVELARGKTLEQALKINREDVAAALDAFPQPNMHCSNLAADGLKLAIVDYMKKKNINPPRIKLATEAEQSNPI